MTINEDNAREELKKELDQLGVALESVKKMTLPNEFHRKIVSLFEKELKDITNYAGENNLI